MGKVSPFDNFENLYCFSSVTDSQSGCQIVLGFDFRESQVESDFFHSIFTSDLS